MTQTLERFAPVDVLVIEYPGGKLAPGAFATIADLAERGLIRVLDLEFVRRSENGEVAVVALSAIEGVDPQLADFEGAAAGLLDAEDLSIVGETIEKGSIAGVLLYEHVWMIPLADRIDADGARIVAAGHVDLLDLFTALGAE